MNRHKKRTDDEVSLVRRPAERIDGNDLGSGRDVGELQVLHFRKSRFAVAFLINKIDFQES